MNKSFSQIEKMTFSAMLLAISVALGTISKFISIPHFAFISISLTPTIVVFSSLCLGPFYGAAVGALADLLPAIFYPTGAYNFILTIVFILLGILPWCLEKLTKLIRGKIPFMPFIITLLVIILCLEIYFFYGTNLLDNRFSYYGDHVKIIVICLSVLFSASSIVGLLLTDRYYQKRKDDFEGLPSPSEISLISFVAEITLLVLLKGAAYYLYFIVVSSTSYRVDYIVIVAMLLMAAPLDILIMDVAIPWMLLFVKKHHQRTEK